MCKWRRKGSGKDCWTDNVDGLSEPSSLRSLHFAGTQFLGIWLIVYLFLLFGSPSLNLFWESQFCVIGQKPSCVLSDALNSEVNSLSILHSCPPPPPLLSLSHCLFTPSSWGSCLHLRAGTHVFVCGISMTTSMWNPFPFEHCFADLHFICMICKQPVAFDSGNGE